MQKRYLLAFDFDGTIARTFDPSPQGIGVNEAYRLAIKEILGEDKLHEYESTGGLRNRSPQEVVRELTDPKDGHTLNSTTEVVISRKLHYLLSQIGHNGVLWPEPCRGFIDFWEFISVLNDQGLPFDTAVISSGHQEFIEKTFDLWRQPHPNILITDDQLRVRTYPKEKERRVKPDQFLLALAHREWLKRNNITGADFDLKLIKDMKKRMIYFGDHEKDEMMAERAKISFGFFGGEAEKNGKAQIIFNDWRTIVDSLRWGRDLLKEGAPISEIFSGSLQDIEAPSSARIYERR